MTAAKVLRHELYQLGIDLEIEPLQFSEYLSRLRSSYTLAIGPLATSDRYLAFFLSAAHPRGPGLYDFQSTEFDAAFDRGDPAAAKAILDREVPFTRLFESRSFAAVDAAYCGDVTPSASSWLWLSHLHRCEEGEEP